MQAIDHLNKVTFAKNVLALSYVLEVSKVELQVVHGILNQVSIKLYAFQFHPVLPDKSQHMVYALLVLQGLTIARAERKQNLPVALAKYPMQVQRLVYGMARLLVQLVHISVHLLLPTILTVLLVLQATHVLEAQLLQLLVLPVKL